MSEKIKVVIADDHAMVRGGLKMFLDSIEDLELVGQASNGREAIQVCHEINPDVVLMDLIMPETDGVEAIKSILAANSNIRIIALTSYKEDELVYAALKAGALNYLLKDVSPDDLAQAIRDAYHGKGTINAEVTQALMRIAEKSLPSQQFPLNKRELEVLRLIVQGRSNSQIANELHLGTSTIKFHVSNILLKIGVASRTEAAAFAVQHKLVD